MFLAVHTSVLPPMHTLTLTHTHTHTLPTDIQYLHELAKEGVQKSFASCYIHKELMATIQEVEKCASVALQIVLGKHKGGSGAEQSLDVEGLKEFLKQVHCLPCTVPEANLLQVRDRDLV